MTAHLKMDEAGRILIPEEIREALGLHPGEDVQAEVQGGSLVLKASETQLVEFEGRLVFVGGSVIRGDPVEEMREARMREILGQDS